MTGMECLRDELIRRGCTKQQADSKVVPVVLDIIIESDGFYQKQLIEDEKETGRYDDIRRKADNLAANIRWMKQEYQDIVQQRNGALGAANRKNDETCEYIKQFNEALKECETPEGRDRMRLAQVFVNSVENQTKYDNTAFIHWLGAILAGDHSSGPMSGYKKTNPKLFEGRTRYDS